MRKPIPFLPACLLCSSLLLSAPAAAGPVAVNATGEQKVLVIMLRFPDVTPSLSPAEMAEKYFVKLDRYLRAVSCGKTWVTGKMTPWYTFPHPVGSYRVSPHNLTVEKDRVMALIQDALDLADHDEEFSHYSMIFLSLGAKRDDYGMMGLCGYPGMLGWQNTLPVKTKQKGQDIPGGLTIYCEQAHLGVVFHDMAHVLGGIQDGRRVLPCLYDHDLQSQKGPFRGYAQFYLIDMGYFDPMSCHYYDLHQGPPGICAWTRMRLGWMDPGKVVRIAPGDSSEAFLGPLISPQSPVQVVQVPLTETTFYLVENRQPLGPDQNLPSHGILISYCDDTIPECRNGKAPVKLKNANPEVPELKAAPFSLTGKASFTDPENGVEVLLTGAKGPAIQVKVSHR